MGRFTDWIKEKLGIRPKRMELPEAQTKIPQVPNNDFKERISNIEISEKEKNYREQEVAKREMIKQKQKDLIFGYEVMKSVMFIAEPEDFKNIAKMVRKEEGNYKPINLDETDYAILADIQKRRFYYKEHPEETNVMEYLEKSENNVIQVVNQTKKEAISRTKNSETVITPQTVKKYIGNTAEVAKQKIEAERYSIEK